MRNLYAKEAVEFLNHVIEEKPLLPFLIPLGFFAWAIERWLVPFSNWIPMAFAVWATIEVGWNVALKEKWVLAFYELWIFMLY